MRLLRKMKGSMEMIPPISTSIWQILILGSLAGRKKVVGRKSWKEKLEGKAAPVR